MRIANVRGRASLVVEITHGGGIAVDIERATDGLYGSDPMGLFARWHELRSSVGSFTADAATAFTDRDLGAPSPRPAQVFGIGLNYKEHARETGAQIPDTPLTFTKFPSSINAPFGDVPITVATADWEAELVVVIGSGGRDIPESLAWERIAGVCVGQDISDRVLQRATQPPQFSLGKSRRGYAPFGPWVVDSESLPNRDALHLRCLVDDEVVQASSTNDMIFTVPQIVAYLSTIVELLPGDAIFTGTPSGVGTARTPQRYLAPGNVLTTSIEGVGTIVNRCTER